MGKYLIQSSYTFEGAKGVNKDGGSARRVAADELIKSVGGKMESFYYAFGDVDVYVIADFPDHASAVACSMAVNTSGMAGSRMVALISPEEVDMAAKKTVKYRAPGQ